MDAFRARIVLEGGSRQPSNTLDRTHPLPFPKFIHGEPVGQGVEDLELLLPFFFITLQFT